MLGRLFRKKETPQQTTPPQPTGIFTTDFLLETEDRKEIFKQVLKESIQRLPTKDSADCLLPNISGDGSTVPANLMAWYGSQSFIGYQLCAIMSQNWLVKRCCLLPAKDATRHGYDVTINDGTKLDVKIKDRIRELDKFYKIKPHMREFIDQGRVFGIRHALFLVQSPDPRYYENPFNPDGVTPGSYRGISQIDPYWITPQPTFENTTNPASPNFYDPDYWWVNGRKIHKSHFVIFKTETVPDILKPTYYYGGVSIPQKIYERVYAAERTANEVPLLVMTKRLNTFKIDLTQAAGRMAEFTQKMRLWRALRDNHGILAHGLQEEVAQLDTSLTDLDSAGMMQYQLVSGACGVPVTKLFGTQPKGFNTTGEYEEANYHEDLESIQEDDLTPLLEGHHLRMILSDVLPRFKTKSLYPVISWKSLDAMTAEQKASVRKIDSETAVNFLNGGVLTPTEVRGKLINDPDSGYSGLPDEAPEIEEDDEEPAADEE